MRLTTYRLAGLHFGALAVALLLSLAAAGDVAGADDRHLYYSFTNDFGTVVMDDTGHGFSGSALGATWSPEGRLAGGSFSFDGNDYISVSDMPGLDSTNITIAMWIKPSATVSSVGNMMLASKHGSTCSADGWVLGLWTGNLLLWQPRVNDGCPALFSTNTFGSGSWIHVACTFDGITERVYVNGVEDSILVNPGRILDAVFAIRLGYNADSGGMFYRGLIDEFIIYSRALSSVEVNTLFKYGVALPAEPVIGSAPIMWVW